MPASKSRPTSHQMTYVMPPTALRHHLRPCRRNKPSPAPASERSNSHPFGLGIPSSHADKLACHHRFPQNRLNPSASLLRSRPCVGSDPTAGLNPPSLLPIHPVFFQHMSPTLSRSRRRRKAPAPFTGNTGHRRRKAEAPTVLQCSQVQRRVSYHASS
jgi:hypothetical protein